MKYYCQRCGRLLDEAQRVCGACGVSQDRFNENEEQKQCKKCQQEIPVNSNFCYHCGADQAQFYTLNTPKDADEQMDDAKQAPNDEADTQMEQLGKQLLGSNYDELKQSYQEVVQEEEKRQAELQKLKGKVTQANENDHPNLLDSTKLYLKDWFNINKRMGRADFWWGFLGMFVVIVGFSVLLSLVVQVVNQVNPSFATFLFNFAVRVFIGFMIIANTSALIRRFRDAEIPVLAIVIIFIPAVGQLAAYLLALKKQEVTNNDYTFIDPVREFRKRRKAGRK